MTYWAIEYRSMRAWNIDYRTVRPLRREALQAPLDLNPTPEYWDFYNGRLRAGTVRAIKVRIVRAQ
jgi:hypothetical protein